MGRSRECGRGGAQDCWGIELRRMLYVNLFADINVTIIVYESTFQCHLASITCEQVIAYASFRAVAASHSSKEPCAEPAARSA